MAKQDRNTIAVAFSDAYAAKDNTGSLFDGVLAALQTLYRGNAVPETDAEFIADEVARLRHWTTSSAKPRKSEVRSVLAQYVNLPDAMTTARGSKGKPLSFSIVVKLARALNRGMSAKQAAAHAFKKAARVAPEDRDLDSAKESTATHIKRVLEHTALPPKFRSGLRELCEQFSIAL